jgi:UDP-2,4-diacetamido-2,4,6-trideoxy-beta-L-altropyranose hydrolase
MNERGCLLIRADANAQMGTGHLMRCLALAQAWQAQGGEALFITACDSNGLLQRLWDEEFRVIELEEAYPAPGEWEMTSQVLAAHAESWLVLDGYHFDPAYQRRIKEADHPLLVIDDMAHLEHYYADVVLNQNIHAKQLDYSCEPDTRLLLGTRYVLLRREFWPWREWEREIPNVARKVLITLGGSDPDNQTLKVIRALQRVEVDGLEVVVVVGASNAHSRELESAVRNSQYEILLVHNVANMPELMAWADVAVSAGGSTCWELAFMALPSLLLVLAENQQKAAERLSVMGVFSSLGRAIEVDVEDVRDSLDLLMKSFEMRLNMSHRGKLLVDGYGTKRVLESFR